MCGWLKLPIIVFSGFAALSASLQFLAPCWHPGLVVDSMSPQAYFSYLDKEVSLGKSSHGDYMVPFLSVKITTLLHWMQSFIWNGTSSPIQPILSFLYSLCTSIDFPHSTYYWDFPYSTYYWDVYYLMPNIQFHHLRSWTSGISKKKNKTCI